MAQRDNIVRLPPIDPMRGVHRTRKRRPKASVPEAGGGDDGGGSMEPRVARLEVEYEHVRRDLDEIKVDQRELRRDMRADFRITWCGLFAVALGLAGLMAKGFGWL